MKTKLVERTEFRDRRGLFKDRHEAGMVLAEMLRPDIARMAMPLILAIPSGGVPVGMAMRDALDLPFDLMIVKKLKLPDNPEAGFGSMTLDGTVFLNERLLAELRLSREEIEGEKRRINRELEKRNALFRRGRPLPELAGRSVILVDDGLASGYTMLASVETASKAGAHEIIVAVPTAPRSSVQLLSANVESIYCANVRTGSYFAVAEAYRHWYDLDEAEVQRLLEG
jgi:putative phosphoribosyl transferase